jgi:cytochrome c5
VGHLRLLFAVSILAAASANAAPQQSTSGSDSQRALLDRYCVTCHNQKTQTAGLLLDKADLANVPAHAELWEKVIRKVRAGSMPPAGMPRPDAAAADAFATWLETAIDRAAAAAPNPGRPVLHRLNRTEYGNAIRDLLAVEIDPASLLPADDSSFGFDNMSNVLSISPALMERYIAAAGKISRLAVGDPSVGPAEQTYHVKVDLSQDDHIEGLPIGTRGGVLLRHNFPVDGEYVIKIGMLKDTGDDLFGATAQGEQMEVLVNGERVKLFPMNPKIVAADGLQARVAVKAGLQQLGVDFIKRSYAPGDDLFQPIWRTTIDVTDQKGLPHVSTVSIKGPYNVTGAGDTPSRRRLFTCHPATAGEEVSCARKILSAVARRAYRRPVSDSDMESLLGFYQQGRNQGDFDRGIEMGIRRILASPQFVFRFERDPANIAPDSPYRLSDLELASRLAFFLWSSLPDDELLQVAAQGKLKDSAVLQQQTRRMLADARSESLATNFGGQWLLLRNLANWVPNGELFPQFDDNLRQSMQRETELFLESVIREDRSVLDLLSADYTFVNERLARHYGIPNIYGSQFRRITLASDERRGLLGQASILTVTSLATRTAPVQRGKWILESVLGTPPNPPPANVPPLKENTADSKPHSVRELMEQHRANPPCAGCHKILDPPGFALENFDAVGAWREISETGAPIDASGVLGDGSKVNGPASLRQAILSRPNLFAGTLTEKLLTYALGRGVEYYDMPAVRAIVRDAARNGYRFSSIIEGIVRSTPFQMRRSPSRQDTPAVNTAQNR